MKTNDELQKDVMEEIKWDPQLKNMASEIGVTAKDGVITLSGVVDTYIRKLAVEKAAQRVIGVKVVAVDIEVKLSPTDMKSDTDIAMAVKNALMWHSAVNEDLIEVKVDNGWVYLDGTVEWDYMKRAAQNAVSHLIGVRGVTNRVTVKTKALDPTDVKRKITAAFHRNATIDSANVRVEVKDNRITLRGKVHSWAERQEAENVAWSSPGIIGVEDKIEVDAELVLAHA